MPTQKSPKDNSLTHSSGARGPQSSPSCRQDGARNPKPRPPKPPKR